jgi:RNA polymerase I specific initiation factor
VIYESSMPPAAVWKSSWTVMEHLPTQQRLRRDPLHLRKYSRRLGWEHVDLGASATLHLATMASEFLFDSFDSKAPQSTRKRHLKTVYDVMVLSILRQDTQRAKRAWAILVRCPDFDTNSLWRIGLGLIASTSGSDTPSNRQSQLDFLRATMLYEKDNVGSKPPSVLPHWC